MYEIDRETLKDIPEHMHDAICLYYEQGVEPGDFLSAVINNDLKNAVGRADHINLPCLHHFVRWFYWNPPSGTWGYPGAVEDYITAFHKETANV